MAAGKIGNESQNLCRGTEETGEARDSDGTLHVRFVIKVNDRVSSETYSCTSDE